MKREGGSFRPMASNNIKPKEPSDIVRASARTNRVIVILGPTGSGKSALALRVARDFGGEIIAADSRTVYKEASIGTAKSSPAQLKQVPHHLVSIVEPDESYSAAEFKRRAQTLIEQIHRRGHLPVMVGGSGLYLDSVLFDYQFPAGPSSALRQELENLSLEGLWRRLEEVDPAAYEYVDLANRRRVIRAIETAGLPRFKTNRPPSDYVVAGLKPANLPELLMARAQKMVKAGLRTEVLALADKYGWAVPVMKATGYGALRPVLEQGTDEDLVAELTREHWRLAKKQLTWFKRNNYIKWFDDADQAYAAIKQIISS